MFLVLILGLWEAVSDYPFEGLRVEQGGDPNDPTDFRQKVRFWYF